MIAGSTAWAQTDSVPIPRLSPLKTAPSGPTESAPSPADADADAFSPDLFDSFSDALADPDFANRPIDLTSGESGQPMNLGPIAAPRSDSERVALGTLSLDARLTADSPPITSGMTWRVFGDDVDADGRMRLVGEATGGPATLKLRPGDYYVHASYGRADLTKKVRVGPGSARDSIVLNAGGMRLSALVGEDKPLPSNEVFFDIYAPDEGGSDERVLIASEAPTATIIPLNAGIYNIVCRYGDANAVVRADIKVEAGKVTDATVYQKAARLTLKLVEQHGGEALANTSWTVITPGGDTVTDSVGAFPSFVLAEGEYTAIAEHENKIHERTFTVEAGLNRDVEVLLTQ